MPKLQARGLGKEERWRWSEEQESVLKALDQASQGKTSSAVMSQVICHMLERQEK
jgi:hypothetical protein